MLALLLLACASPEPAAPPDDPVLTAPSPVAQPNLLVLVLDDVGADSLAVTNTGFFDQYPSTPNLDALASEGVIFRNAWSNPTCTPSRASMLLGRTAWRNGTGNAVAVPADWHLPPGTDTVAVALSRAGYATAAIGKWHLGEQFRDGYPVPDDGWGFAHSAGTIGNLGPKGNPYADPLVGYYHYLHHEDGQAEYVWGYATTRVVDDTLDWLAEAPEPWFGWVAFQAAHAPFQPPPPELVTHAVTATSADYALYGATIEALDAEIGRLLAGIDPAQRARTTVMVVGDNGIPFSLLPAPLSQQSKGTTYQLGIHVPLFVAGASVAGGGRESDALVSLTDVAATLTTLGHNPLPQIDGQDFSAILTDPSAAGPRELVFSQQFIPNFDPAAPLPAFLTSGHAVRDARYKLREVWTHVGYTERSLYDLAADPWEETDLLIAPTPENLAIGRRLRDALDQEFSESPVPR